MSKPTIIKTWWVVELMEAGTRYETGGAHDSFERARRYLDNCVMPKRRRKNARIMRHEETSTEEFAYI